MFDYELFMDLLKKYVESADIMSYPGFLKFVILERKMDKSGLRSIEALMKSDPDLFHMVKKICEGDIVDKCLLGSASTQMGQFVLKKHHEYDNTDEKNGENGVNINISIDERSKNV